MSKVKPSHPPSQVSFFQGGLNFLSSAKILAISGSSTADSFALIASHSLEVLLKSYLLSVGFSEEQVIKLGHNFSGLWNETVKQGLDLEGKVPDWVEKLDAGHSFPYLFRYARNNTAIVVPNFKKTIGELERVVSVIGKKLGLDKVGNFV